MAGKRLTAKVWLGYGGDGAFVRGGTGRLSPLIRGAGGKYNTELRGWTCTKAVYESFRMVYVDPVEILDWATFELAPFQPREHKDQAVRISARRNTRAVGPTTQRGTDGFTRALGPV